MKPFLKWLGNKYRHIDTLLELMPKGKRLVEPFTGSGALYLNTHYKRYLLGENNPDLVYLYKTLQKEGEVFIEDCRAMFLGELNHPEAYYALRQQFNSSQCRRERAKLFIYLNRHGYNGLCRYNLKGGFNVPFGRYIKPYFPEIEMRNFYQKSQSATFQLNNYLETLNKAKPGDVVYCDPPYDPISKTANFTAYTHRQFNQDDQIQLINKAEQLATIGIPVIVSNNDTPFMRRQLKNAEIHRIKSPRFISCKSNQRHSVHELIAVFRS